MDGNLITPKDGNGNVIEPFIYEGTTYLPVRAIGEAFNKAVSWDGITNSIYVGQKPGETLYLGSDISAYTAHHYNSYFRYIEFMEPDYLDVAGQTYFRGIIGSSPRSSNVHGLYNLNGQFTTLSGLYGPTNRAEEGGECLINFYADGQLIKSLTSQYGDLPKNFSVDLTGVLQLKIEFIGGIEPSAFCILNPQVK